MEQSCSVDTLQSLLGRLAQHERRPALIAFEKEQHRVWSFQEVSDMAGRLASGLVAAGLRPGERAVLSAPGSAHWVVACFALIQAGAVPVPVDTQAADGDLRHI